MVLLLMWLLFVCMTKEFMLDAIHLDLPLMIVLVPFRLLHLRPFHHVMLCRFILMISFGRFYACVCVCVCLSECPYPTPCRFAQIIPNCCVCFILDQKISVFICKMRVMAIFSKSLVRCGAQGRVIFQKENGGKRN